jgi:hypothetical protein
MNTNWNYALTTCALSLVVTLSLGQAAAAQGRGNGKPGRDQPKGAKIEAGEKHRGTDKHDAAIDRDGHRRIVGDYFRQQALPPGLAKRESLPPGLARQLREGGELPPGLEKRLIAVPPPLHSRLPRLPATHQRYFVGNDLIVVDSQSHRVMSIFRDVLR